MDDKFYFTLNISHFYIEINNKLEIIYQSSEMLFEFTDRYYTSAMI